MRMAYRKAGLNSLGYLGGGPIPPSMLGDFYADARRAYEENQARAAAAAAEARKQEALKGIKATADEEIKKRQDFLTLYYDDRQKVIEDLAAARQRDYDFYVKAYNGAQPYTNELADRYLSREEDLSRYLDETNPGAEFINNAWAQADAIKATYAPEDEFKVAVYYLDKDLLTNLRNAYLQAWAGGAGADRKTPIILMKPVVEKYLEDLKAALKKGEADYQARLVKDKEAEAAKTEAAKKAEAEHQAVIAAFKQQIAEARQAIQTGNIPFDSIVKQAENNKAAYEANDPEGYAALVKMIQEKQGVQSQTTTTTSASPTTTTTTPSVVSAASPAVTQFNKKALEESIERQRQEAVAQRAAQEQAYYAQQDAKAPQVVYRDAPVSTPASTSATPKYLPYMLGGFAIILVAMTVKRR